MKLLKKGIITLTAIALFLVFTMGFTRVLLNDLLVSEPEADDRTLEAYPRAVTQPAEETEAAAQTTAPAETGPELTTAPTLPEERGAETTASQETAEEETLPPETTEEPRAAQAIAFDAVPLFYMSDYPEVRYLTGSLATSGSNVASVAMAASYLTKQEYRPDALMTWFDSYIGNSMQWLEHVSDQLQLPWEKAGNFHDVTRALEEGKIAIIVMAEQSFYTENLHFIVLTGINEEGLITVNDPLEAHYSHWNLGEKLEKGFASSSLVGGYRGGWIYDPAAVDGEPFVYQPEENTDVFRYPGVELTEAEMDLMAKIIWLEAQGEPYEGQQAIAEVILNRLAADSFPDNIRSILYAQDQFRGVDQLYQAKPTHVQYAAIAHALKGPYILPEDVVFFAGYAVNSKVWGTIGQHTFCYQE